MLIKVFNDKASLGKAAAEQAATAIRRGIAERDHARIIAATAASQLEFLDSLTKTPGIDWQKVEAFHLDEYIGLPVTHPGSFRKMLLEQLVRKTGITKYHLLEGDAANPAQAVRAAGKDLVSAPIDIAFLGYRRKRAHRFQRSSGRLRNGRAVHHREPRRSVPPAAGGRGVVRQHFASAEAGDLHVGAPDSESKGDSRGRA